MILMNMNALYYKQQQQQQTEQKSNQENMIKKQLPLS